METGAWLSDGQRNEDWDETENWFYSSSLKREAVTDVSSPPAKKSKVCSRSKRDSLTTLSLGELRFFVRQRQAVDFLQEQGRLFSDMRIFSLEDSKNANGARKYAVSSVARFWQFYSTIEARHCYEVIAEHERCRLYFDLEFQRAANPNVDEQNCLKHFFTCLRAVLLEMYEIDFDCEKHSLILDSSTAAKFSQHVILHLPGGRLFQSCMAIRPLAENLSKLLLVEPPHRLLLQESEKETVLCDLAVYTRNRNFRLFLSSKAEKKNPLVLARGCKFYGDRIPRDEEIFLDSLCVPLGWQKATVLQAKDDEGTERENPGPSRRVLSKRPGTGPSPWPILDDFMLSMMSRWRSEGDCFRKWQMECDESGRPLSITYYPLNSRYCFNIGREHKSNGTYWCVNLSRLDFTQRCFDYECRGGLSNSFLLPNFLANQLRKELSSVTEDEKAEAESFLADNQLELSKFYDQWENIFDC